MDDLFQSLVATGHGTHTRTRSAGDTVIEGEAFGAAFDATLVDADAAPQSLRDADGASPHVLPGPVTGDAATKDSDAGPLILPDPSRGMGGDLPLVLPGPRDLSSVAPLTQPPETRQPGTDLPLTQPPISRHADAQGPLTQPPDGRRANPQMPQTQPPAQQTTASAPIRSVASTAINAQLAEGGRASVAPIHTLGTAVDQPSVLPAPTQPLATATAQASDQTVASRQAISDPLVLPSPNTDTRARATATTGPLVLPGPAAQADSIGSGRLTAPNAMPLSQTADGGLPHPQTTVRPAQADPALAAQRGDTSPLQPRESVAQTLLNERPQTPSAEANTDTRASLPQAAASAEPRSTSTAPLTQPAPAPAPQSAQTFSTVARGTQPQPTPPAATTEPPRTTAADARPVRTGGWTVAPASAPAPFIAAPSQTLAAFAPPQTAESMLAEIAANALPDLDFALHAPLTLSSTTALTPTLSFLSQAPSATAQVIAQQIAATLNNGSQEAGSPVELALDPPELGRVRMQVSEIAGVMTLTIHTERPETADLMRRHLDLLAQEFAQAGLDAPTVHISQDGADQGDQGRQSELARDQAQQAAGPADETPHTQPQRSASGGLDLRL